MKKLIISVMAAVVLMLASCGLPEDETSTASSDHALISSQETKEKKTEKESPPETRETGSEAAEKPEHFQLSGGLKAVSVKEAFESAEPSGEEHASSGGGPYAPEPEAQTSWQQEPDSSAPAATQVQPQSTACRHDSVYISGAYPATCVSHGYSGDTVCALCGELLELGHATEYADHSWVAESVHEDAYLTCYCGLVFYSADDHDRHVNEMVDAGESAGDHGCVWTPGRDYTVYTCSVCGETLNN